MGTARFLTGRRGAGDSPARGTTFIELMVSTAILLVLAMAALPVAEASRRRESEVELRRALRSMRQGLVMYHVLCESTKAVVANPGAMPPVIRIQIKNDLENTCFPKDLDVLVDGVETDVPDFKIRFLRRIPRDPLNVSGDDFDQHGWRLISSTDRVESTWSWNHANVMDVRSGSKRHALDGSLYENW